MRTSRSAVRSAFVLAVLSPVAAGQEWPGFRGPDRNGVAEAASPPIEWSHTENIAWRTELPGAGTSSPVIAGDRVFVTCYSGYGLDRDEPGNLGDLVRHLVCVARKTGKILWQKTLPSTAEELGFRTQARENGYATPTPVTDGERIYVYFGRSGVFAFGMDGEQLWQTDVGKGKKPAERPRAREDQPTGERGSRGGRPRGRHGGGAMVWGAAASPLVAGDLLIVLAADPSSSLRALDTSTGKEAWRVDSDKLGSESSSPLLVHAADGSHELVLAVAGEVWGLDPESGSRKWTVEVGGRGAPTATPVADRGLVFVPGGMGSGSAAIRAGAIDDADRIVWRTRQAGGIPSPVLHGDVVYLVDRRGIPIRIDAKTGEVIDRGDPEDRLSGGVYASPVLAADKLYVLSREGRMHVFSTGDTLELLASNQFDDEDSWFNASPAIVGNELFVRSNRFLYCVKTEG